MRRASVWLACLWLLVGCSEDLDILFSGGDAGETMPDAQIDASVPLLSPMILYRFDEGAGDRVLDSSDSGPLVHLTIEDTTMVRWIPDALVLESPTRLTSAEPPTDFIRECQRSGGLTIEAWLVPAETIVNGTRRIITLSANAGARNFLLGQGDLFAAPAIDAYVLRLRTSSTGNNGLPMLSTGPTFSRAALTQVIAIHRSDGSEAIYVDGRVVIEGTRLGDFSSWADDHVIAVGDELGSSDGSRAWLGELHLIALFPRALTPDEVQQRFGAGGPL